MKTELTVRVQGNSRHGMHVWLGDVFDHNGDIVVPSSNSFIVGSGNESPIVVHKSNGVHGS